MSRVSPNRCLNMLLMMVNGSSNRNNMAPEVTLPSSQDLRTWGLACFSLAYSDESVHFLGYRECNCLSKWSCKLWKTEKKILSCKRRLFARARQSKPSVLTVHKVHRSTAKLQLDIWSLKRCHIVRIPAHNLSLSLKALTNAKKHNKQMFDSWFSVIFYLLIKG